MLPVPCLLEQELVTQQEALLSQHSAAACNLEEDEQKLTSVRSELQTNRTGDRKTLTVSTAVKAANQRAGLYTHTHTYTYCICIFCVCVAELKRMLLELLREQQMLEEATHKRCQCVKQLRRKQRQLDEMSGEVGRAEAELLATQGEVEAKRAELEKLQEEVKGKLEERQRAELCLKKAELCLEEAESGRKEAKLRLEEVELRIKEAESRWKEAERRVMEAEQLRTDLLVSGKTFDSSIHQFLYSPSGRIRCMCDQHFVSLCCQLCSTSKRS